MSSLQYGLQGIGIFSLLASTYAVKKTVSACAVNHCDGATASATMGPGAYGGLVVWITGASSGIGKEMSMQLGRAGAKLILSSRREKALNAVKFDVMLANKNMLDTDVVVLPLDLEDIDSLDEKAVKALSAFGKIDMLVNNGGVSTRSTAKDASFGVDLKLIRIDYLSAVKLTKAVLPSMRENGGGRIVNISSVAGKAGVSLRTAYCGAKHALIGWMDALRVEMHADESNIYVCNICPGSVQTDVAKNSVTSAPEKYFESDDVNIKNGLTVEFAVEKMLAAAYCHIDEVWIAKGLEMMLLYMNQYAPEEAKKLLKNTAKKSMEVTLAKM